MHDSHPLARTIDQLRAHGHVTPPTVSAACEVTSGIDSLIAQHADLPTKTIDEWIEKLQTLRNLQSVQAGSV
ncbi:MAG: hypothetical protein AAB582_03895 [Patescibacteria group bacterium]